MCRCAHSRQALQKFIPSRRVKRTVWSGAKQLILSLWLRRALVIEISRDKFTSKGWNPAPPSMPMVGWWTGRCFVLNVRWHRRAGSTGEGGVGVTIYFFCQIFGPSNIYMRENKKVKKRQAWDEQRAQMFRTFGILTQSALAVVIWSVICSDMPALGDYLKNKQTGLMSAEVIF